MTRALAVAAVLAGVVAAPAPAAVRLAGGDAEVHALAVAADGAALAVVDSGRPARPFGIVRSRGRSRGRLALFGQFDAEFPDLSARGGRVALAWGQPVSGGERLWLAPVDSLGVPGPGQEAALATGPPRLALDGPDALLAYPERAGDAVLARVGAGRTAVTRLTQTAPERRHLPLDVAVAGGAPLVLDLVQRRQATELLVLGPGAPAAPVTAAPALRHVRAGLAASSRRIAVAYLKGGRAHLAVAAPGDRAWRRRVLPGRGGGAGTPAVAVLDDAVLVAYAQRVRDHGERGQREILTARVDGSAVTVERVTDHPADDRDPHLAARPEGSAAYPGPEEDAVYLGWTRRVRRPEPARVALLERVG